MRSALQYYKLCSKLISENPNPEEHTLRLTPEVEHQFLRDFDWIRKNLGSTFSEMFSRESEGERDHLHDAIHSVVSWKLWINESITPIEAAFLGIHGLQAEVFNGGFHQFFFNSSGAYWPHIFWAMHDAGDTAGVERFSEVLSIFSGGQPAISRKERWAQLENLERWPWRKKKMNAHFDHHDRQFYDSPFPDKDLYWALLRQKMPSVSIVWPQ